MASVVADRLAFKPTIKALEKEIVGEIDAPQRVVTNTGFGQRSIEVEHADQARPFAAPIGDGQDGPLMRVQSVEQMMSVLPDGLHHYQRRSGGNISENLHSIFLAVDESVLLGWIVGMSPLGVASGALNGRHDRGLDTFLRRPTLPVGGQPQISICDYNDRIWH